MAFSQHFGFSLGYIILVGIGIAIVMNFVAVEGKVIVKMENVEDAVVMNRIVKCFSEKGQLGLMDVSKFNEEELIKCGGDKYAFSIDLSSSQGQNRHLELGELGEFRELVRYVLVDGNVARLEMGYGKDVA